MIRLYIENQEMDVTAGFSHQITYAVDDLQNLDSKATAFSKTIVLPGTAKNNYLLGNIFEFSNANFTGGGANVGYNFNASKSAKCRLEINGLQIIKGVMRLLEIIRDEDSIEYEVAIFGELGGFFTSLSNKKLTDLDFSVYDHTYTIANIADRWDDKPDMIIGSADTALYSNVCEFFYTEDLSIIIKIGDILNVKNTNTGFLFEGSAITNITFNGVDKNTITISSNWTSPPGSSFTGNLILNDKGGAGVYYPLIDFGNYSTNKKNYIYRTFRPALFLREYIHKIITGAGYTYESKFFESNYFNRLIIPSNQKDLYKKNVSKYIENSSATSVTVQVTGTYPNPNATLFADQYFGGLTLNDFTYSSGVFTYTGSTPVNLKVSVNFNYIRSNTNGNGLATIYHNNNIAESVYLQFTTSYINATVEKIIQVNAGDTIRFRIISQYAFPSITIDNQTKITAIIDPPGYVPYNLNNTLKINDFIPENIYQKDFFASVLKMFYLMVTEDKYREKHLHIEPFTWFYNLNSNSYIDWSMKLDRSQPIRIKPMSEINSRYYEIKFKSDTDYYNDFYKKKYNEGYGDIKYDNALEFAKDVQTTEVIFSSTPLLGYNGEDKVVPAIFKWDGKTIGTNEETVNSNIRIMQCKTIYDVDSWSILNDSGGTAVSGYVRYPYAGHLDDPDVPGSDINFGGTQELFFSLTTGALGNNLFNTFYSSYLAEITDKDSRLVTAKFKLNDTDIFNLDFGRFIYLDGVLYRLSRVVDYTPGEICTVELLRVIYTTYDSSVNASDDPEIMINGRTWKAKNLDTEYYNNGDIIPQITDETEWADATEGAWCYYENNTANGVEYGKLYNWYAINDSRGIAPDGWSLPTENDLIDLADYTNGTLELKEIGTTHWNAGTGTDDFGFKALGAGRRRDNGGFDQLKTYTYYWTRDEYDVDMAYYGRIQDSTDILYSNKEDKNYGFSIRLIKDI